MEHIGHYGGGRPLGGNGGALDESASLGTNVSLHHAIERLTRLATRIEI